MPSTVGRLRVIDLHCHSTASDGHLAPAEVIRHAAEIGLSAVALTDHDTLGGLLEAIVHRLGRIRTAQREMLDIGALAL